jgi:hypothetical protein
MQSSGIPKPQYRVILSRDHTRARKVIKANAGKMNVIKIAAACFGGVGIASTLGVYGWPMVSDEDKLKERQGRPNGSKRIVKSQKTKTLRPEPRRQPLFMMHHAVRGPLQRRPQAAPLNRLAQY